MASAMAVGSLCPCVLIVAGDESCARTWRSASAAADRARPIRLPPSGRLTAQATGRRTRRSRHCRPFRHVAGPIVRRHSLGATSLANEYVMSVEIAGSEPQCRNIKSSRTTPPSRHPQICCQTQVQQRLVKTLYRRAGVAHASQRSPGLGYQRPARRNKAFTRHTESRSHHRPSAWSPTRPVPRRWPWRPRTARWQMPTWRRGQSRTW